LYIHLSVINDSKSLQQRPKAKTTQSPFHPIKKKNKIRLFIMTHHCFCILKHGWWSFMEKFHKAGSQAVVLYGLILSSPHTHTHTEGLTLLAVFKQSSIVASTPIVAQRTLHSSVEEDET
jgi:hypothetical protein